MLYVVHISLRYFFAEGLNVIILRNVILYNPEIRERQGRGLRTYDVFLPYRWAKDWL